MALILKAVWKNYDLFMNDMMDKRVEDWLFMGSSIPVAILLATYLYFVNSLGPKIMEKRKAFKLDNIIIFYNIIQILLCAIIVYRLFPAVVTFSWRCAEVSYNKDDFSIMILRTGHIYFITKLIDLLDTVFFILRKKQNQVSFLHVYHHALMVLVPWIGTKYFGGGHTAFLPFINSFVHVVMYTYYLATAWNKELKNNAWWKKYITQLQLFQFGTILVFYSLPLLTPNCGYPKAILVMTLTQNLLMFILFGDFYYKAYIKKSK